MFDRLAIFRAMLNPVPETVAHYQNEAEMLRLEDAVEEALQHIDWFGVGSA